MAKAARRKPSSRVKYEQSNPTVSCRVPRDIYDALQTVKASQGTSFGDILMVGLGILEKQAEDKATIRERAHAEGYKKGYAGAESLYKVTYPCNVCRKMITVTSTNEKEAIKQYMQEHGWGHQECHEKRW